MSLGRVVFVGALSAACAACGGRAIVDGESTASGGSATSGGSAGTAAAGGAAGRSPIDFEIHDPTNAEEMRCSDELSQFSASATLIDQEYDGTCTTDSDCHTASVETGCLRACVAAAVDAAGYGAALSNAGDCSACPPRAFGDPCANLVPVCDRGHCKAQAQ